jgi:hypothetical protein
VPASCICTGWVWITGKAGYRLTAATPGCPWHIGGPSDV